MVVLPYQFSSEIIEVIQTNNYTFLLNTITSLFLYLMGFTMRDMSLSLVNRPFVDQLDEGGGMTMSVESKRANTQLVIDQRRNCHEMKYIVFKLFKNESYTIKMKMRVFDMSRCEYDEESICGHLYEIQYHHSSFHHGDYHHHITIIYYVCTQLQ